MFGHIILSLALLFALSHARFYGYQDVGDEQQQEEETRQLAAEIDSPFGMEDAPLSANGELLLPPYVSCVLCYCFALMCLCLGCTI